jgi:hypothetical protein
MKKWFGTPIETKQDHRTVFAVCISGSLLTEISVRLMQISMEEEQIIQ